MTFIQVLDLRASNYEEIHALDAKWRAATEGRRTLRRAIIGRDRNDSEHYLVLAFFDDYEAAMTNSAMPETDEFATNLTALLDGPPAFVDLDVIDDQT